MGRSYTPAYRLEFETTRPGYFSSIAWEVGTRYGIPGLGKPTPKNIDKWVTGFEQSCIDGPNKHLGIFSVTSAKIIRQKTGEVVATWERKSFRPDEPKFRIVG